MLIRRNDFNPIENLSKGSSKEIWYTCDVCGCGYLTKFYIYNKKDKDICKSCKIKEKWKDDDYRKKCSIGSPKKKKSFKPQKEKYYHTLKKLMEDENYKILTSLNEYLHGKPEIKCLCPERHINHISYKRWTKTKTRCVICKENKILERIQDICDKKNFTFLKKYTKNKKPYIKFKCNKGHINDILLCNFYKETECGVCSYENRSSKPEMEICEFLEKNNIKYIKSDRKTIHPLEIDILLPDHNIGIEYNGAWYHDEYQKEKYYHLEKTKRCEEKNIRLIHIFDDEWELKKEIVKHRLKQILNITKERVYARKCVVKEISPNLAKDFCEKYHIQGYGQSNIKLGLFYEENLISIMTFSKPNISKGSKNKKNTWELNRFCSSCSVVGGASKLLEYFKKNYTWELIYSYSDRRWNTGNLYQKIGFYIDHYTEPNYWYWNRRKREVKRYHRFNFRKDKIKNWGGGDTEVEIMHHHGWARIWDCGNILFKLEK